MVDLSVPAYLNSEASGISQDVIRTEVFVGLVESCQAVEKGSFLKRVLQNPRKRSLREALFISYANLEST